MTSLAVLLPQEELNRKSSAEDSLSSSGVEFIAEDTPAENNFSDVENQKEKFSENSSKTGTDSEQNLPDSTSSNQPKSRNRKKRKWKPYAKMTWIERKKLEERDARRANRIRDEMTASGFALAPYNTTQFLMADQNVQEPDYARISNGHRNKENSHNSNYSSSDEYYSSPEDEEEFIQQQFVRDYENIHSERLHNMTKTQLVEELISVEDKVEALEKILEEVRAQNKLEQRTVRSPSELEKIRVFREEIEKLKKENLSLEQENEKLQSQLNKNT